MLYAGGIARGSDEKAIHEVSGMTKIRYQQSDVFEPLSLQWKNGEFELKFTQPLAEDSGITGQSFAAFSWGMQNTQNYGGPKVGDRAHRVEVTKISENRRSVRLRVEGIREGRVLNLRVSPKLKSEAGEALRSGDAFYTMTKLPGLEQPTLLTTADSTEILRSGGWFDWGGDELGASVYQTYCMACHRKDKQPGIAPSFAGLYGSQRKYTLPSGESVTGLADEAYLRESILEPNAKLTDGYAPGLMPMIGGQLSKDQLDALVKYIKGIK